MKNGYATLLLLVVIFLLLLLLVVTSLLLLLLVVNFLLLLLLLYRFIREVLDRSGGASVKIISKIENEAGLENYDDILSVTDGIMVARGDLAMEVRGLTR